MSTLLVTGADLLGQGAQDLLVEDGVITEVGSARSAKGADVLVHEVMYLPELEKLIATEPNARTLREHLIASHTTTEEVGRVATEAGVKTLVLSHFVPGGYPFIKDEVWLEAVRPHFKGEIVVGRDLMEL